MSKSRSGRATLQRYFEAITASYYSKLDFSQEGRIQILVLIWSPNAPLADLMSEFFLAAELLDFLNQVYERLL
jgi:hypothetical protein